MSGFLIAESVFSINFAQDRLSGDNSITDIACRNSPCSEFYTVLYDIGSASTDAQLARAECTRMASEDKMNFPDSFIGFFPLFDCPCSLFQAFRDARYLRSGKLLLKRLSIQLWFIDVIIIIMNINKCTLSSAFVVTIFYLRYAYPPFPTAAQ